jgi:hypothetical protein
MLFKVGSFVIDLFDPPLHVVLLQKKASALG